MKLFFVCLCIAAIALVRADEFNAPTSESGEEMRKLDNGYESYLDELVAAGASKLFNGTAGTVNAALAEEIRALLEVRLTEVGTSTVRQCSRLSNVPLNCYACENGAVNISRAEINVVLQSKIYSSVHNNHDSHAEKTAPQSFSLLRNSFGYIFTASLPCRAVPTCFANATSQLIRIELEGPRLTNFKRIAGKMLIDQMNLGAFFSQLTGNVFPNTINGGGLVPTDIMDNAALMGIFCVVPSKRRGIETSEIVHVANRGLIGGLPGQVPTAPLN